MAKSASGKEKRSFTVVDARRVDGCATKFKVKGDTGRYLSNDARGASKKAFTTLCRIKRIRGQCALVITMKETTQGSAGKEFTYKLRREKLETPIVLGDRTYEYETVVKSVKDKSSLTCKSDKGKSSGPMKSKKSKKVSSKTESKSLKSSSSKSKKSKSKKSEKKGFLGLF